MKSLKLLRRESKGAAVIELAFALPILIIMLWAIVQAGLMLRALSGIQHALGEGARAATIWPVPGNTVIGDRMTAAVYGIGPGDFVIPTPVDGVASGANYVDLTVTYTQQTDLLVLPGPTVSVSRSKRVWKSESDT